MEGSLHPATHPIAPLTRMPRRRRASAMQRVSLLLIWASAAAIATATATTAAPGAPGPMAEIQGRIQADMVLSMVADNPSDRTAALRCTPDVAALARAAQASLEADFTPEQRMRLDMVASSPGAQQWVARSRNLRRVALGEAPEPIPPGDPKDQEVIDAFTSSPLGKQFSDWFLGLSSREDAPMQRAREAAHRACLPQQGR